MKVDITSQMNRAGQEFTCRPHYPAAAGCTARRIGLLESDRAIGAAVAYRPSGLRENHAWERPEA
jgi:hypothetical protein